MISLFVAVIRGRRPLSPLQEGDFLNCLHAEPAWWANQALDYSLFCGRGPDGGENCSWRPLVGEVETASGRATPQAATPSRPRVARAA